jgi:hypothetical protein
MFKKEAEKWVENNLHSTEEDYIKAFKDAAEFGYNKANEWHYMKDVNCYEDLHFPPEEEEKGRVLIWKVQVITEKGVRLPVCYHCGSYGDLWYEINAYHVIAWKEIVLPKEIE